jgi:hypothetical protein
MAYDVDGEYVDSDEQLVFCVRSDNERSWFYVEPEVEDGDPISLPFQCDGCGLSEAFVVTRKGEGADGLSRVFTVTCSESVVVDNPYRTDFVQVRGCGCVFEVVRKPSKDVCF